MTYIILGVVVILVVVYSVINSKQRKKQIAADKEKKDNMAIGTKVITIGGIVGTVVAVEENEFIMSTEGSVIRFDKRAIYQMITVEQQKEMEKFKAEEEKLEQERLEEENKETEEVND